MISLELNGTEVFWQYPIQGVKSEGLAVSVMAILRMAEAVMLFSSIWQR